MDMQNQWIQVNGLRIHTMTAGEQGSPVVLLHGGGIDSARLSWELLLPVLAQTHRVFAADWPGYGDSDKPQADYSMDYYIQFLAALMAAWGLDQASLVGISLGGGVALGYTLRAPEHVARLVLVDSYGLQSKAPLHQLSYLLVKLPLFNALTWALVRRSRAMLRASLQGLLHNPGAVTEALVDQALLEVQKPGAARAWMVFQNSEMLWRGARTCYLERLGELTAPTLIIHGRQDRAVPLSCAEQAHTRIQGSQLQILEGCGHWPQRDHPDEFNRLVADFLAE